MKACPSCAGPNPAAAVFCRHCGARFAAAAPPSGLVKTLEVPSKIACPRCRTKLTEVHYGDLVLDECSACRGTWFDKGELRRAAERLNGSLGAAQGGAAEPQPVPPAGVLARMDCPLCRRGMTRFTSSGVYLDRCDRCGLWVDGHEIERLLASVQSVRLPRRRSARMAIQKFYRKDQADVGAVLGATLGVALSLIAGPCRCRRRTHCCCW